MVLGKEWCLCVCRVVLCVPGVLQVAGAFLAPWLQAAGQALLEGASTEPLVLWHWSSCCSLCSMDL